LPDNCYAEQLQDILFISPLLLSDVVESSWTLVQPQYVEVQRSSDLAQQSHHQTLFSSLCIHRNHFDDFVNWFVLVIALLLSVYAEPARTGSMLPHMLNSTCCSSHMAIVEMSMSKLADWSLLFVCREKV
jgi:hypothetical protein